MTIFAVNLLGALIALSALFFQSSAPTSPGPGIKELIDNPRAFICDVTWTKGEKWPTMKYEHDTLVVPLTTLALKTTTADGKTASETLKVGQVKFWPKGTEQALEVGNDGRAIVAHFKASAAASYKNTSGFGPAFPRPRAKKLLETDRLVVWDYTWIKGDPTPKHFHDKDLMVVYMADGAINSVTSDGKATPNEFKFAEVRFNTGNRAHYEEYLRGDGPRAIITELK
jgi:hypothetical protein